MKVGQAQRDVPAHIAHEYCRPDRSFNPLPSFNEENLPRILAVVNYSGTADKSWFPLASSSSGLGFDFALIRNRRAPAGRRITRPWQLFGKGHDYEEDAERCVRSRCTRVDLEAIRHLDEVRINDLTQSRENIVNQHPKGTFPTAP